MKLIKWIAAGIAVIVVVVGVGIGWVAWRSGYGGKSLPLPATITADWVSQNSLYGVSGRDARGADFTQLKTPDLVRLTFDSKTQWPDTSHLPSGFRPAEVLEAGKDPGLGLRQLHSQGVTGKGVGVAMIDKAILPDHRELSGRIKYIEVMPEKRGGRTPHFHGMATASILAGAGVGVAPGAFLYYFAVPDDVAGFKNYVVALEQLLALNDTLPKADRIRVVSVSWSPTDGETREAWGKLVARAKEQGMAVVYSQRGTLADYIATGPSASLLPDRNDPNAYDWGDWVLKGQSRTGLEAAFLGVPASFRTTASVTGPQEYAYWGDSGQSWAIPYFAGMLTLGLQVNPDANLDDLYRAIDQTAVRNSQGIRMVNPAGFVAAMRK